jgi:hypothetical protein
MTTAKVTCDEIQIGPQTRHRSLRVFNSLYISAMNIMSEEGVAETLHNLSYNLI